MMPQKRNASSSYVRLNLFIVFVVYEVYNLTFIIDDSGVTGRQKRGLPQSTFTKPAANSFQFRVCMLINISFSRLFW